jgi:hypothetical protein
MPLLSYDTLSQFSKALETNKIIQCDDKGNWDVVDHSTKTIQSMLGCKDPIKEKRLLGIIKMFTRFLNEQEAIPVAMDGNEQQKKRFRQINDVADKLEIYLKASISARSLTSEMHSFKRNLIGFWYRIEKINGGIDPVNEEKELSQVSSKLESDATQWMQQQEGFKITRSHLDALDKRVLHSAAYFPKFIELMQNNAALKDAFFKWCLRDVRSIESVATFIQFPALCDSLKKSYLDKHAAYHDPSVFKIRMEDQQKLIKMPFYIENKPELMSILDKTKIIKFNKTCKTSIKDIFKRFEKRNDKPDNVDYFEQGFINWNSAQIGWWQMDPITNQSAIIKHPLNSAETPWWLALPTFLTLNQEQVKSRYHLKNIPDNSWIKCALATCDKPTYQFAGNHGGLEIAIPVKENRYQIYPFGIYPVTYSSSPGRGVCGTVRAECRYPDDSIKFTSRLKAFYAQPVSEEDGLCSMSKTHKLIQQARTGNLFFQTADENCAYRAGSVLESKEFPSCKQLFGVTLREMNPSPWEGWFLLKMPNIIILPLLQYFADTYQLDIEKENGEMTVKKVDFFKKDKEHVRSLPSHLFFQILNKKLPAPGGFISYANEPIEHPEEYKESKPLRSCI